MRLRWLPFLPVLLAIPASSQAYAPSVLATTVVAALPAASLVPQQIWWVRDATSTSDCSVGGGSTLVACYSNGASWSALGSAGGVTSLTGTANQITASASTGAVTLSVPTTLSNVDTHNSTAGTALNLNGTAPAAAASSTAGTATNLTASAAIAGTSNAGAAAGGAVTITAGAAARLTSGNANGGNINLTTGAGIGTGTAGQVLLTNNGALGAPALAFANNSTAGFYYPGSGSNINFVLQDSLALVVPSTGNSLFYIQRAPGDLPVGLLFYNGTGTLYGYLGMTAAGTLQMGIDAAAPVAQVLKAPDGSGTDKPGANLTVSAGNSTGAGTDGIVKVAHTFAGSTGSTQNTSTVVWQWNQGHAESAGTAPTVGGSCGSSPTITGTDVAGKVTAGTGAPTSCTVTFAKAWTNAPSCHSNDETTSNLMRAVSTTTTVVISGTIVAGDVISYLCLGRV